MKITRIFTLALCVLFFLALFPVTGLSAAKQEAQLQFGSDGEFKILHLADIQTWFPMMRGDKLMLRAAIEAEQPDLIALGGDQLWGDSTPGDWYVKGAIRSYMDVFEEYGIPVAMVFGNHDAPEGDIEQKQMMMELYESYDCFIGGSGAVFGYRVGNQHLPILSSDGSRTAFNLYFFDNGRDNFETEDGSQDGYACITEEQINWYIETSNALKEANGGQPVPSINFQHMVVTEIFDALVETGHGWTLPENAEGFMREGACPPSHTHGQFDAFVAQGDIIATVSGHDHGNAYVVPYQGIDIINTQSCGFGAYSSENMGYRVLVLNENDPWSYETYIKTYYEIFSDDPSAELRLKAHQNSMAGFFPRLLSWDWIIYNWDYALIGYGAAVAVVVGIVLLVLRIVRKIQRNGDPKGRY